MKNRFILLVVAVVGCLTCTGWVSANDDTHTVKAKFAKPFKKLTVPSAWKVEDSDKNDIEFEHIQNDDITFELVAGKQLKKDASLDVLQTQIENFVQKKTKIIPLLAKSFGNFDPEEMAEAQISLEAKQERVVFGKIEWLKLFSKGEIEITITIGDTKTKNIKPTRQLIYIAFIENRLHLVTFSAPLELFDAHAPLFEQTMQSICK